MLLVLRTKTESPQFYNMHFNAAAAVIDFFSHAKQQNIYFSQSIFYIDTVEAGGSILVVKLTRAGW